MGLSQADIKLLWGRAASRCSICRKELTEDSSASGGSFSIGEQAHIVGEKDDAARGKSILTEEERNSYANIILLCPNCHSIIDKNPGDWPAEKLYITKSNHELFIQRKLGGGLDFIQEASKSVLNGTILSIVKYGHLEEWANLSSDAAFCEPRWKESIEDDTELLVRVVFTTIWPKEYEELRRSAETFALYLQLANFAFLHHSMKQGDYLVTCKFYKAGGHNPNYDADLRRYKSWLQLCVQLVNMSTMAANWFSEIVRRDINPVFFLDKGKFYIPNGDPFYSSSVLEFSPEEKCSNPVNAHKMKEEVCRRIDRNEL